MIEGLVHALRPLDPTAEELADALWLAQRLRAAPAPDTRAVGAAPPLPGRRPTPGPEPPPPRADAAPARPAPAPAAPPPPQAGLFVAGPDAASSSLVRAPAVPALPRPLRLARALRPLRVPAPAPARVHLDEAATAAHIAESGVWEPVLRPATERRFDLALVVDGGSSMAVWRRTVEEFRALLAQLGAFRDIRVWDLDTGADRLVLRTPGGSARSPRELLDPTGRRVVLVVSDCVGAAWRDGRVTRLLERWARSGPLAVVQPLPQRMWWRCAVPIAPVRLAAGAPGLANDRLTVVRTDDDAEPPTGVAIPVMELEARWLRPWAAMVATGSGLRGAAFFTGAHAVPVREPDGAVPAADRVRRFRAVSSPTAFKLATYLAAAPLRPPVMRLVQRAMLPLSTPAHLAEVLLGDLLRVADPGPDGEDGVAYEFHEGVGDILLGGLRRGEALQVLREVWAVVRERLGSSLDFPALLGAVEADRDGLALDRPFARVAARVLARLGGRYTEIAERLGSLVPAREPGTARDLRPPTPVASLPPRDPGFTGREGLLAAVNASLGEAVTALLPAAEGGVGLSAVAAEYAHRHAHEYDLAWWVPAGRPSLARAALARLAAPLGVAVGHDVPSTADGVLGALAAGGRWLLVLDGAGDPADLAAVLPPTAGRVPGHHVLVTSRDPRWREHAAVIEVGAFERGESVALLRHLVPGLSPGDADRAARLVGDHPLAVRQAGGWLGLDAAASLRRFAARAAEPGTEPRRLAASAELAVERLDRASPPAAALLRLCAFFGPEPVDTGLLSAGGGLDLPAPLVAVVADGAALRAAVRRIGALALAHAEGTSPRVHGLVRTVLRDGLSPGEAAQTRRYVHAILAAAPDRRLRAPHVHPSGIVDGDGPEARGVVLDQVEYLRASGDLDEGRSLAAEALDRWRARYGSSHEHVLRVALGLARILRDLGRYADATAIGDDVLTRSVRRFGPDHPGTLAAAAGAAADLRFRGDFERALRSDRDTWLRRRQIYGDDDARTLRSVGATGVDLRLLGRFHEALDVDNDTVRRLQRRPGPRFRELFRATHQLARDLHGLGRYAEALPLQEGSLLDVGPLVGTGHPLVLAAVLGHAGTLRKTGELAAAERRAAEAVAGFRRRPGAAHANTAAAVQGLAMACRAGGDPRRARPLVGEALGILRPALGADHPLTRACEVELGAVLRADGDPGAALESDQAALAVLTATCGADHPTALCCAAGVATDLYLLGELDAADELAATTHTLLAARLGPQHPDALACAHNHALVGAALGRPLDTGPARSLRALFGERDPRAAAAARGEPLECEVEPTPL